jgi:hypothetical protein
MKEMVALMNSHNELNPELEKIFRVFKEIPGGQPTDAAQGRAAFLFEAQQISQFVTERNNRRHNIWIDQFKNYFSIGKEKKPMLNALTTLLVVLSLALGGGGATVAYAQSSLPDQALYGFKLMSEEIRQNITTDPQTEWQLALELAGRRLEEIQILTQTDKVPNQTLANRYQNQIEQSIRFAANLPDEQVARALEQIRTELQTQQEILAQARLHANMNAESVLLSSQQMLQQRINWVDDGLQDPILLRDRLQQRDQQHDQPYLLTPVTPTLQTPVPEQGVNNPWTDEIPTPGSGYGPGTGSGDCPLCTPVMSTQDRNTSVTGDSNGSSGSGNSNQDSGSGNGNTGSNGNGSGGNGNGKH